MMPSNIRPGEKMIAGRLPIKTHERLMELSANWDLPTSETLARCVDVVWRAINDAPKVAPVVDQPKPLRVAVDRIKTPARYTGPTPADPYAGLSDLPPHVPVTVLPARRARGI